MSWSATRFDGRTAQGEVVLLRVDDDALVVVSRSGIDRLPLTDVDVSEGFDHAPRMLRLPAGATLEVPDPERTLGPALAAAGVRRSWVVRMQAAWPAVVVALALLVGGIAGLYVVGLPIAARHAADAVPADLEQRMGENLLTLLDANSFERSQLDSERRERITRRFLDAAARVAPGVPVRLEFRAGVANAFALPGGTIVLFDDLVDIAQSDEAVLGVLGHELGHVANRHSLRQLMQALGTAALAGLVWGDFSTVAANVPVVLGVMRYGRGFEEEADEYAIRFLAASGLSPRPLREFFIRLQRQEREKDGDKSPEPRRTTRDDSEPPEFLSSHPSTSRRLERLQRATEAFEAATAPPR